MLRMFTSLLTALILTCMPAVIMPARATADIAAPISAPLRLDSPLTDEAGVLSPDEITTLEDELASLREETNIALWVVFVADFDNTDAGDWAEATAQRSNLAVNQLLLAVAVDERSLWFYRAPNAPVSSSELEAIITTDLQPAFGDNQWADGVSAAISHLADDAGSLTTTAGTTEGKSGGGFVRFGLLILIPIVLFYVILRRTSKTKRATIQANRQASITELRKAAGTALVDIDDALRSAKDELGFAQAEFGIDKTDEFTASLRQAQSLAAKAFAVHRELDQASTPPRDAAARYRKVLELCEQAETQLHAHIAQFTQMRDMRSRVEEVLRELDTRAVEVRGRLEGARSVLNTLVNRFSPAALASFQDNPARAREFLDTARTAIAAGQQRVVADDRDAAVVQARLAEGAISQASELLQAVYSADEMLADAKTRLPQALASIRADISDANRLVDDHSVIAPQLQAANAAIANAHDAHQSGDPIAALNGLTQAENALDEVLAPYRDAAERTERARERISSQLADLDAHLEAINTLLHTHRRQIGSQARLAFSQALELARQAHDRAESDPHAAIGLCQKARDAAHRSQQLATADAQRATSYPPVGMPGYGNQRGPGFGTLVLADVLGNILTGSTSRGSRYGGLPRRGGFGGGFGGGSSRGGGGSFGGSSRGAGSRF
ncbi:MAG: TPM domain-containing protein [Bowdeniella nasicola]|nr:TPM domain-containing protein [Bowdeniella nasicola]